MLIITERDVKMANTVVKRMLPYRKKRMIGPFIFIDHFGPVMIEPPHYMDVDQHPHIGIATLSYLYEGSIDHADSLGTVQRIDPGDVNFMVAGKGITHTERIPEELKDGSSFLSHGFQIWVALPVSHESMEPEFQHLKAKEIPSWSDECREFKLIAGKAYGKESPLHVYSDLFLLEIKSKITSLLNTGKNLFGEMGFYVVHGSLNYNNEEINTGQMLVLEDTENVDINFTDETHVLVFGGQPFPEERHIYWNFVASDSNKINQAIADWKNNAFPKVPGDDTYVPLA